MFIAPNLFCDDNFVVFHVAEDNFVPSGDALHTANNDKLHYKCHAVYHMMILHSFYMDGSPLICFWILTIFVITSYDMNILS